MPGRGALRRAVARQQLLGVGLGRVDVGVREQPGLELDAQDAADRVVDAGHLHAARGHQLGAEVAVVGRDHLRVGARVERVLRDALGFERILWLAHGHIEGDDTDGHVDTLARFCDARSIAYSACADRMDTH